MKSTRKPFYNHRIAQSKEKWETEFLSKIDDANDLLYLAAVKSNGYSKIDNSYYTEDNKSKILSTLDDIVNNPYNKRHHSEFSALLEEAKSILDKKTKSTSGTGDGSETGSSSSETSNRPSEGPGRSTAIDTLHTGQDPVMGNEDLFDINKFSTDAKIFIQDIIEPLKKLSEDKVSFKSIGDKKIQEAFSKFNELKPRLTEQEDITINTMLINLQSKYMAAFSDTGVTKAGRSYFVVSYIEAKDEAISLLSDRAYLTDPKLIQKRRDQIESILNIYQTKFINTHPQDYFIGQYIKPINQLIGSWNFRYTDMNPRNNTNVKMLDKLRPGL